MRGLAVPAANMWARISLPTPVPATAAVPAAMVGEVGGVFGL
jgi:hypothetical protein